VSKLAQSIAGLHQPIERALFRALAIGLAFLHAGLVLWEPTQYAEAIGGFNARIGPLLIWAVCSGVIFGIGFTPINWYWRLLFSPYISLAILGYLTLIYFV
jgi:cyd operon protein YbgE